MTLYHRIEMGEHHHRGPCHTWIDTSVVYDLQRYLRDPNKREVDAWLDEHNLKRLGVLEIHPHAHGLSVQAALKDRKGRFVVDQAADRLATTWYLLPLALPSWWPHDLQDAP